MFENALTSLILYVIISTTYLRKVVIIMFRAYKFRLYPSDSQKEKIHQNFGCARVVYNYFLNSLKENNNRYLNPYACNNILNNNLKKSEEYFYLNDADSCILYNSIFSLANNLDRFNNSNFGFPKFKSKFDKNSYTTNAVYGSYKNKQYCNIEVNLENKTIKLPKLKEVKIRGYRKLNKIEGRIKRATITKENNGKYYVSVMCELREPSKISKAKTIVGIDVGVSKLLTLSDGITYENNRYIKKYEKRIKRLHRELSRKEKASKNYYKCKQKLAILYSKLANARKYYQHEITKKITDEYDIIIMENLNTKNIIENSNLSKSISDASFRKLIRQIKYKSQYKGKYMYQVDTYYPSSQICSRCGNQDSKYKDIQHRNYECKICNNNLDRDFNASVNIMFEGLKQYMESLI